MKRSIFVATLALTPALLHAQATTPAQTSPVLQARLAPVAVITASSAKTVATAAGASTLRVSTGVVAPHLLNPVTFTPAADGSARVASKEATVVLTLKVDESGTPRQVAVEQSVSAALDRKVVEAISQARFKPGTLDGQPCTLPVRLRVVVERGTEY